MVSGKCLIWMGECRITLFHHLPLGIFDTTRNDKESPQNEPIFGNRNGDRDPVRWIESNKHRDLISKYIFDCTKYYISKYIYILDYIGYWIVKYLTFHFWLYNPLSRPSKPSEPNGFHRVTGFAASTLEHQASQVDLPPLVASIIKDVWRVKTMV